MGKGTRKRSERHDTVASANSGTSKTGKLLVKIGAWTLVALFLCVLAVAILHTTGVLQRTVTAVTINDEKVSALDFNIYYRDARTNFLNQYGSTLQQFGYTLDGTLDAQDSLMSEGTWKDYFNTLAADAIKQTVILYNEGKAAGFAADEKIEAEIADHIAMLDESATANSMTQSQLLAAIYGNGTKLADIERVYRRNFYADAYGTSLIDSYNYTDDDVETYYQENRLAYDSIDYYSYVFNFETIKYTAPAEGAEVPEGSPKSEEEATAMTDSNKAAAKARAEQFLAEVKSASDFDAVAEKYFLEEETGHTHEEGETHEFATKLTSGTGLNSKTDEVSEWLKADTRAAGDIEIVEAADSFTVAQYVSRQRVETPTATVRHVLYKTKEITEETSEDDKAVYEFENNLISQKASAAYTDWLVAGADETAFAELAETSSEDTGSNTNGGLYEHLSKGTTMPEFDAWCFDPERKPGDNGTVKTDYGYHLMYYVSSDKPAYYYSIINTLKSDAYTEYYEGVSPNYTVTTHSFGMTICF